MRMRTKIFAVTAVVALGASSAAVTLVACSSLSCEDDGTCAGPTVQDGGTEGGPVVDVAVDADDGSTVVPGCEQTPRETADVLQDKCGMFVAPSGDDAADGSRDKPYRSLAKAITEAKAQKKFRVYACSGTFDEYVVLDAASDGVSLFGGLTCPGAAADAGDAGDAGGGAWTYVPGTHAIVRPATVVRPASTPTLRVDKVTKSIAIEDFELDAKDGVAAGESSIAAYVSDSPNVALRRVALVAGTGRDGAIGAAALGATPAPSDAANASGTTGGEARTCACDRGGVSIGGPGGAGGIGVATGGDAGSPDIDGSAPGSGAGGNANCTAGTAGASAPAAGHGIGAIVSGSFSATTWLPASGASGAPGKP
ncbi:MAG: Endoglucanase, partial [Myxococcaceae bacterium]|nr:Endoglucanase [Myxococcaceae bacterium]